MANAHIHQEVKTIVLELTEDEAQYLYDLLGYCVYGNGRRLTCSRPIVLALDGVVKHGMRPTDLCGEVHVK